MPQTKNFLLSISRLLQVDPTSPSKSLKATSVLLALLLRTGLLPLPNLPQRLLSSSAANPNLPNPLDPSPWNTVIAAFSRHGFPSLALQTFSLMHRLALPLDSYALCSSLTAAATSNLSKPGTQIHACASKSGQMSSIFVGGSLIDFYAKTKAVEDARQVFDEIPMKTSICLNSLLNGYVERRLWMDGLYLFQTMYLLRLEPDRFTLSAVLRICAQVAVIGLGMQVHAHLIRRVEGMEDDSILLGSLVEMYGKCGLVGKARLVFELAGRARGRDVVVWTSMLNAYGRNGQFDDVIGAFEEMLAEGAEPDEVVFLAVLSAFGRSGNVARGLDCLELMGRDYGMVPGPEHYGCVVDMLCRAGELEKAWKFASERVVEEEEGGDGGSRLGVSVWGAILSACRDCGNVEIGKVAAWRALELDPNNVGIFVELSNLYASVGMWDEIGELREMMKERGLMKGVGCSWLELVN